MIVATRRRVAPLGRQQFAVLGIASVLALASVTSAAAGGDAATSLVPGGVGVAGTQNAMPVPEQINHDAVTETTQALAVDLGADAVEAVVTISNLIALERGWADERGKWQAFDSTGKAVASGEFTGSDPGFSGGLGTVTVVPVAPATAFRYVVFTALAYEAPFDGPAYEIDSSDYLVRSIAVTFADDSSRIFGKLDATADDWAGVGLSGFNFGTDFLDGNGGFVGAPIVVDTENCSTGQGTSNAGCDVPFTKALTTTIAATDIKGTIEVAGRSTVVDFRTGCGFPTALPAPTPPRLPGAIKPVEITTDGGLDLGFVLDPDTGVTGPIVPAHLCGTPPAPGAPPQFVLLDLDAAIAVSRSVIEHEVANSYAAAGYECKTGAQILALPAVDRPVQRSRLPVFGWLPKSSNPEIPVLDRSGLVVPELQDVTTGCGSTRSSSRTLSFLVYDLHHRTGANYRSIIDKEITELQVTVDETPVCIDSTEAESLKSQVRLTLDAYRKGRFSAAKKQLIGLQTMVSSKRLDREFAQCAFDLLEWQVFRVDPAYPERPSRNFRGDLTVQIQHILYMMDRMLGV